MVEKLGFGAWDFIWHLDFGFEIYKIWFLNFTINILFS